MGAHQVYKQHFIWCSIHASHVIVRGGLRWHIGNAEFVNVWKDPWLRCDGWIRQVYQIVYQVIK